MKHIKLCFLTNFDFHVFQWFNVLKTGYYIGEYFLDTSFLRLDDSYLRVYPFDDEYWTPLRTADIIFVYVSRSNFRVNDEWYMLPVYARRINPKAKILVQFDDECKWIFNPHHTYWGEKRTPKISDPEKFIKEKKFLEVGDIYLTVVSPEKLEYAKYCSKPIKKLLLPHLIRYAKPAFKVQKKKQIVIMRHSIQSASIQHTIDNVIKPLRYPTIVFNTPMEYFYSLPPLNLPPFVKLMPRKPRDAFIIDLMKCRVGIDDNEGYVGWSRFAMECAIAGVACIGSTEAVKDIFPDLFTEHKDYEQQKILVQKLMTDDGFYKKQIKKAKRRLEKVVGEKSLIKQLLQLILSLKKDFPEIDRGKAQRNRLKKFIKYVWGGKMPCRMPSKEGKAFDPISKRILTQEEWLKLYGEWKEFFR